MKTLKMILHATNVIQMEYESFVDAPDDANPDDIMDLLNSAIDGSAFEEVDGDWHYEGEEWSMVEEATDEKLPRWRYVPGDTGTIEQVLTPGESGTLDKSQNEATQNNTNEEKPQ